MQELKKNARPEMEKEIDRQIRLARYGAAGENNIAFELKNSGMDMYILHDIYLETETLAAQIDYIVVTRQCTFIIECKNLIGNITIDNTGSKREMYSTADR